MSFIKYPPYRKPLVSFLIGWLLLVPLFSWANTNDWEETGTSSNSSPSVTVQEIKLSTKKQSPFTPGDGVIISNLPDSASILNNTFPIDDEGFVDLPIIGRVKISEMTEKEFVLFLQNNFKEYLKWPTIQVRPAIRVSILGGIKNPGLYYVDPHRSLWDVVYIAGGTLDEDGLKQMRWERDRKTVKKNLIPFFQQGISLQKMGFQSGDQIWVKTPGKEGIFEKAVKFLPVLTLVTTMFTLYFTYQQRALTR